MAAVNRFESPIEPIPLLTLRGRRAGPLPAFLNIEVLRAILEAIQRGAWDYVACQAAGVPKRTFEDWMRRGRADAEAGRDTEFSRFSRLFERAKASAHITAEMRVFHERPQAWLLKGPGRASPANPEGWGKSNPSNESPGSLRVTFDIAKASGRVAVDHT